MKLDHTHITVLLDRSGSMEAIRDDVVGGFNAFLAEQKARPGTADLSLVQFDSQDPCEVVHDFRLLDEIPPLDASTFVPRASTPLLDALGRAIIDLRSRLAGMPAPERPELVVFAVLTDGMENASREFTRDQIVKMIARHQGEAAKTRGEAWEFAFLSADLDAIGEARDLGFLRAKSAHFASGGDGVRDGFTRFSSSLSRHRSDKRGIEFDKPGGGKEPPGSPGSPGGSDESASDPRPTA